jgi:hypothetical protein
MPIAGFTGVKTFTATRHVDREQLGDRVTDWLREHPTVHVCQAVVTQSSDAAYHCISITVLYREKGAAE